MQSRLEKQAFQEKIATIVSTIYNNYKLSELQSRLEKQAFQVTWMKSNHDRWIVDFKLQSRLEKQAFQELNNKKDLSGWISCNPA